MKKPKPSKKEILNYMKLIQQTSKQDKDKETKDEKLHTVHND